MCVAYIVLVEWTLTDAQMQNLPHENFIVLHKAEFYFLLPKNNLHVFHLNFYFPVSLFIQQKYNIRL